MILNKSILDQGLLGDIASLSVRIGSDIRLTQGAGGNTSIKEGNLLWVKASGKWLAQALTESIFVAVELKAVLNAIKQGRTDVEAIEPGILRPSIETTMHALIPHAVVVHAHSLGAMACSMRREGRQLLKAHLKGMNWAWVPYARPGLALTKAIQEVLKNQRPDVFVLENHGVVIGAEDCKQAELLLADVETRLRLPSRENPAVDLNVLTNVAEQSGLVFPKESFLHSLATDGKSLQIALGGVLYPDQAVFMGVSIPVLYPEVGTLVDTIRNSQDSLYFIFPKAGVLVNPSINPAIEQMLLGHALLLLQLDPAMGINYLAQQEVEALVAWEAEKFRKLVGQEKR